MSHRRDEVFMVAEQTTMRTSLTHYDRVGMLDIRALEDKSGFETTH
jgi:hypothetical protein